MFRSNESKVQRDLEKAEAALLQAQDDVEYAQSVVAYNQVKLTRLKQWLVDHKQRHVPSSPPAPTRPPFGTNPKPSGPPNIYTTSGIE